MLKWQIPMLASEAPEELRKLQPSRGMNRRPDSRAKIQIPTPQEPLERQIPRPASEGRIRKVLRLNRESNNRAGSRRKPTNEGRAKIQMPTPRLQGTLKQQIPMLASEQRGRVGKALQINPGVSRRKPIRRMPILTRPDSKTERLGTGLLAMEPRETALPGAGD